MNDEPHVHRPNWLQRLGALRPGVWSIKHIVAPLDRWMYRRTQGRRGILGRPLHQVLLLTTIGYRTGQAHTVPVFYMPDGASLLICNVTPQGERQNPWPMNLRAHPQVDVQIGADTGIYQAREATAAEVANYWPQFISLWPAYQNHYAHSGQRALFILAPTSSPLTPTPPAHT